MPDENSGIDKSVIFVPELLLSRGISDIVTEKFPYFVSKFVPE